jgi:hypothetical protein
MGAMRARRVAGIASREAYCSGELAFAANITGLCQGMHASARPLSRSTPGPTSHCSTPRADALCHTPYKSRSVWRARTLLSALARLFALGGQECPRSDVIATILVRVRAPNAQEA